MTIGIIIVSGILIIALAIYINQVQKRPGSNQTETEKENREANRKRDDIS